MSRTVYSGIQRSDGTRMLMQGTRAAQLGQRSGHRAGPHWPHCLAHSANARRSTPRLPPLLDSPAAGQRSAEKMLGRM